MTNPIAQYSDAFELGQATQVCMNASWPFVGARDAYVETFLQRQGDAPLMVSFTEIKGDGDCANGATLRLGPGRYNWYARVMVKPGGAVSTGAFTGGHQKFADLDQYGEIGMCRVSGTANGFLLASCVKARDVWAAVTVRATLNAQERIRAELRAADNDDPARFNISSFRGEISGTRNGELKVDASPLYFRADRVFRFSYGIEHEGGGSPASITLGVGGS